MSRLKFGIVTHIGSNLSIILSSDTKYEFATSSFPKAELGFEVTFNEDTDASTSRTKYAKNISALEVKNFVIKDLLERVARLEDRLAEGNKFVNAKIEERDYALEVVND
jgi:hypothetical protein